MAGRFALCRRAARAATRSPPRQRLLEPRATASASTCSASTCDDPAERRPRASRTTSRSPARCRPRRRTCGCRWTSRTWRWTPTPPAAAERLAAIARSLARRPAGAGRRRGGGADATPCWPACLRVAERGPGRAGSAPRCRPTSCARPPTPMRWPTRASTSGSSRAPTSSPPARTPTASRPTWPSCASASALAERGALWSMATHDAPAARGAAARPRSVTGRAAARRAPGVAAPSCTCRGVPDPRLPPLRPRVVPLLDAPGRRVPRRLTGSGEHRRQRPAGQLHGLEVVDVGHRERQALDADVAERLCVLEDLLGRAGGRAGDPLLGESRRRASRRAWRARRPRSRRSRPTSSTSW